jgi:hypothetical protein
MLPPKYRDGGGNRAAFGDANSWCEAHAADQLDNDVGLRVRIYFRGRFL